MTMDSESGGGLPGISRANPQVFHSHTGGYDSWGVDAVWADPRPGEALVLEALDDALIPVPGGRVAAWWAQDGVPLLPEGWPAGGYISIHLPEALRPGWYEFRIESGKGGEVIWRGHPFRVWESAPPVRLLPRLLGFLRTIRCSGLWDEADREVPVHGSEGQVRDVRGGWYDASGDRSKYLSHLSYAGFLNPQHSPLTVWVLCDARDRLNLRHPAMAADLDEDWRDEILWGADFLVRMQDESGAFYKTVFDNWSHDPTCRCLCSYRYQSGERLKSVFAGWREGGGMAVAALARASRMEGIGDRATRYARAAERGLAFLMRSGGAILEYPGENIIDDYTALLGCVEFCLAGLGRNEGIAPTWQWAREEGSRRLRSLAGRVCCGYGMDGWFRADDGMRPFSHAAEEGLPIIAMLRYLEVFREESDPDAGMVRESLVRHLRWTKDLFSKVPNPFGLARQLVCDAGGGFVRHAFFMSQDNESGYWWQGENARLASLAAAWLRACEEPGFDQSGESGWGLRRMAISQMEWILGKNPFDVCMLEGFGRNNPAYGKVGANVSGGVCNGITARFRKAGTAVSSGVMCPEKEAPGAGEGIAFLPPGYTNDPEHEWRWGEQWLPHASWLLLALSWG